MCELENLIETGHMTLGKLLNCFSSSSPKCKKYLPHMAVMIKWDNVVKHSSVWQMTSVQKCYSFLLNFVRKLSDIIFLPNNIVSKQNVRFVKGTKR